MAEKRDHDDRTPSAADAYAPPPRGPRSRKIMMGVAAIVVVCVVAFFLVLVLG